MVILPRFRGHPRRPKEAGMTRRKRRAFTPEFKAEAVRLAKASDRSIGQVAKELDLTETALRSWVKRADIDTGKGPPEALTTPEREELQRLRREVKRLEMEREILKKAAAFFAKESE
jgi:transposase